MSTPNRQDPRLVVVMVGLPARGKSFIARKLQRYLNWLGYRARVFNAGDYRRQRLGAYQAHDFFDPDNPAGSEARKELSMAALDDLLRWLAHGGDVGIHDATNATRERRRLIRERCDAAGKRVLFVESVCRDASIVEANVLATKLTSPDYVGMDPEEAVQDFRVRIAHYERSYVPLVDEDGSWVKLIDVGRRMTLNRIGGHLPARIVYFLMNTHITPRRIWLSRHGQSEFNVQDRVGGDPPLSAKGLAYARNLAEFVQTSIATDKPPRVWQSMLTRSRQTAEHLMLPTEPWKALDEIDAGICDGLTYTEIETHHPEVFTARRHDKLRYRYPQGESYVDVIQRLDPMILEMEREEGPLLIISHNAVLRALYGYLTGRAMEEVPHVPIPLHTLIELIPTAYGCNEERYFLGPVA